MFQILNSKSTGNNTETTSAMEVPGGVVVKTSTSGPGSHSEALVFMPGLEICDGCLCAIGTAQQAKAEYERLAREAEAAEQAAEKAAETPKPAPKRRRFKAD